MTNNNLVYSYSVGDVVRTKWGPAVAGTWRRETITTIEPELKLPGIVIFGPGNDAQLQYLRGNLPKHYKIVFEGKKATNSRAGHGYPLKRNTVIILDKNEDQALPEVP